MIEKIRDKFGNKIKVHKKNEKRHYIDASPETSRDILSYMFNDLNMRFSIASGIDTEKGIEILYHMAADEIGQFFSVRILLPKSNPSIKTVSDIIEGTTWIEREIREMLGVNFEGHPDPRRLLLPDDWPEDQYPLRKDFKKNG
jgi:Ni,Fe-hydrogenase III component G